MVYNRRIRIQNKLIEKEKISFKIFFSIIVIGIVGIQIHYQIDIQYQEYIYNKTMMVEHIGIYYYHIEDAKEFLIETLWKEIANKERMKWIYDAKIQQKSQVTEYTGSQQGKNIIIVQLESLNEFVINKQINGMEITPNLNRFYQENIYCSDMYNQGLGTTADSEHTVATSLYPLENGRVFQKYFRNQWNSLYQEVKKEGYYTSFMHPNVNTFWNRYEVYKGGYKVDQYEDITQFQTNGEMAGEFFSDEQFLTQSINKMRQYKEPFCTMLVAISTHTPYSLDGIQDIECKVTINTEGLESEELEKYLKSCNFVDYSFGRFMEELEKTELLKNSIVVVYGDHGAGVQDTKAIQKLYEQNRQPYNSSIERLENVHVPFGLKIPNWNGIKRIDKTVSKLDVKPTILDLLGIQDTISLGKSIFIAQDSSFIKGIGFVTSENYYIDGEYIDRQANAVRLKDDKLEELTEQMEQEFYFSDTLIRNNLLK